MITDFGWSDALQAAFDAQHGGARIPARILTQHRDRWRLATPLGERDAHISGRFAFEAGATGYPVVGDWCAVTLEAEADATIHAILRRRGLFARAAPGGRGVQAIAANVDHALLVVALDRDFNLRRLERYLIAAHDAGAAPIVTLTKADLSGDLEIQRAQAAAVASGAPVLAVSAATGAGLTDLRAQLAPGSTSALLGSSGAGKSTLLNALAGDDVAATGAVREGDGRGRHTTRRRELFRLLNGALLIDTPGMRELGLTGGAEADALDAGFADVAHFADQCRFRDCSHGREPGCAVHAAIATGALDPARLEALRKLERERAFAARREDPAEAAAHKARWKTIHKHQRAKSAFRDRQGWDGDD